MPRLGDATLAGLPASVARPAYDRARRHARHRASRHRRLPSRAPGGLHRRRPRRRSALGHRRREPAERRHARRARAAGRALHARGPLRRRRAAARHRRRSAASSSRRRSASALLAAMADPRVRIVSLTVTEKGYCHDPATGELNEAHPDIVHDLADAAGAAHRAGLHRRGAARAGARRASPPFTRAHLRQPSLQRRAWRSASSTASRALRDPDLGAFVAGGARLSLDHGRPHHAGDDRRRPRRDRRSARRRRCLAGAHRAVLAMGDRGPLSDRPPALGGRRARSSSPTSSPTS